MISYERDPQQNIPESSVKIIGLGGAGANMLDRAAMDGMTGAELLSINTDIRNLTSSVADEKIQIGKNLTKGLGAGGDPALGLQAAQETEEEIRAALKGRRIIFLCVGLGGGTGSGAAPLITRIAREENAFVVVFATMPFRFEGQRRQSQAESTLNELAVLANALVTFDNGRMGELVLAKQGIHEAFAAADRMISESIKAVTRLVIRPGLINIGLDELMTALRTTRSRCLFGSGIAKGENRSHLALENALTSPLLDKGGLLKDSTTVLVHICGGESLTLYEIELLMQNLGKYIPKTAHVLFGAAVDPSMGESLSVTLVSALPEEKLNNEKAAVISPIVEPEVIEEEPIREEVEDSEIPVAEDIEEIDSPDEEPVIEESEVETEDSSDIPPVETEEETTPVFKIVQEDTEVPSETDTEPVESAEAIDIQPEEAAELPIPPLSETSKSSDVVQPELKLDGAPKGKFEGSSPNYLDGEDLDIPPFLRKKRS